MTSANRGLRLQGPLVVASAVLTAAAGLTLGMQAATESARKAATGEHDLAPFVLLVAMAFIGSILGVLPAPGHPRISRPALSLVALLLACAGAAYLLAPMGWPTFQAADANLVIARGDWVGQQVFTEDPRCISVPDGDDPWYASGRTDEGASFSIASMSTVYVARGVGDPPRGPMTVEDDVVVVVQDWSQLLLFGGVQKSTWFSGRGDLLIASASPAGGTVAIAAPDAILTWECGAWSSSFRAPRDVMWPPDLFPTE